MYLVPLKPRFYMSIPKLTFSLVLLIGSILLLTQRGCSSDNGFRVEHSARMVGGFDTLVNYYRFYSDTIIKPKQKIVYHNYELKGSDTLFRFLIFAINNPDDISKNQRTQLLQWINTLKQDTTIK